MDMKFTFDQQRGCWSAAFDWRRGKPASGTLHGGIIATILDEAMGKVNKIGKYRADFEDDRGLSAPGAAPSAVAGESRGCGASAEDVNMGEL